MSNLRYVVSFPPMALLHMPNLYGAPIWFFNLQRDHPFKTSAIFHQFLTSTPLPSADFSTIRRQIWQIFDPSRLKTCQRLKWMVPLKVKNQIWDIPQYYQLVQHKNVYHICEGMATFRPLAMN